MLKKIAVAAALLLAGCTSRPAPAPLPTVPPPPPPLEVQIIGINDFHGNLETPTSTASVLMADGSTLSERMGGAAAMAATVKRLRDGKPNSITVSAGDLIGASPLVSAYFLDEPTIQAMNALGLGINAVGNHEFDKGSAELLRMQKGGCEKHTTRIPCRVEPFGGASFEFLAANVQQAGGSTIFPGSTVRQFGPVTVAFIGMTLKETETLVTPTGVAGLRFMDEAASANALVPRLKAEGADAIVLVIHQGGKPNPNFRQTGCDGFTGSILPILDKLDPAISVVVSGHTHYAYACELDRGGARRLLTSAGRYGYLVTDIRLTFDPATQALTAKSAVNVPVRPGQGADEGVSALVARYAAAAAPAAARPVGRLKGNAPYSEVYDESPASNLIADAQLAATRAKDRGDADISFINSSGVRTSITPDANGHVTYGQIFAAQPFGNNLVVKSLTGAQLKALLEQQFVVEGGRAQVGSLLAPSADFQFSYDLSRPEGQRIVSMRLDGKPIRPEARYRVTVNNFLASGGDGFSVLTQGTDTFDAGLDLDALEAWLATNPTAPAVGRTRNVTPR
jgi:5'-nucleotidase